MIDARATDDSTWARTSVRSVVVLGPRFAAARVAVDLGDTGPDMQRRSALALTYERQLSWTPPAP